MLQPRAHVAFWVYRCLGDATEASLNPADSSVNSAADGDMDRSNEDTKMRRIMLLPRSQTQSWYDSGYAPQRPSGYDDSSITLLRRRRLLLGVTGPVLHVLSNHRPDDVRNDDIETTLPILRRTIFGVSLLNYSYSCCVPFAPNPGNITARGCRNSVIYYDDGSIWTSAIACQEIAYKKVHENIRDVISPPAHPYRAIFELVNPFDHKMVTWKFRDDISNGSGVIVLTDKQTDTQTDATENNTTLTTLVVNMHDF